ncbi:peptide/nickel transport system ATP-binding protein [Labedella gwakjiensis]|uniref:ABC transporter ATP-binding protein n=1 Tax=Labedella gwakjiensis TaxID=390269 RepID=A0A2P8GW75_9MICO|nr:ABC transporter ATP-binding protein [Labedella gwakjiensis]PSL38213.1 peptide/nickel transport system ATP-binding protein [Labedella gwakjiensis]RUQ87246.1 ABC transporter ATP-binding protein [Labedella gwakjiensis]
MSDNVLLAPTTTDPEDAAPTPLLQVRDLTVSFGTSHGRHTAVSGASLDLPARRTLAVVGESGSGKSTLAAAINRLLAPNATIESGSILFDGRDLVTASPRELTRVRGAGIGLVPQDPMSNLDPVHRVGAQIVEALEAHGTSSRESTARAIELLDMVGIPEPKRRFRQFPHEFSGGMRQRVLIAIGLACRPKLLIADEPTSALDVTVQRKVLDRLDELTADMGTALFMITHDLALAAERASDVLVMHRGTIVEHGPADQLLADPQHEYTRKLLDAAPALAAQRGIARAVTPYAAAGETGDAIVSLTDVVKEYTVRDSAFGRPRTFAAVAGSTFDVPRGSTVAIVGESGSGKSSTARLVLGLDSPTRGTITFDGRDLASFSASELRAFRRRVQPVFQNPFASLDSLFTVGDTIAEPLVVHGIGTAAERRERVLALLEEVALPADTAERYPHQLSGGQRQRVAIARALALQPEVLVLDEAVSALDVVVQAQILDLLARLQREHRLTYLFISHDLAVVRQISDCVHVMSRGRIVETGTPDELFESPQEDYTRELLSAIPGARLAV